MNLNYLFLHQVSEVPVNAQEKKAVPTFKEVQSESERKAASMKAMFQNAVEQSNGPLVQDLKEGVEESEWD